MDALLPRVELAILAGTLAIAGWLLVPCHQSSMWADLEFTGWVAPIADRLTDGQRLYGDGLHIPMAPLPFVFLRILFGSHATWWSESLVNFAGQVVAILALYVGMRRHLPAPVPFLAAFATIPAFLFLAKSLAYDGMVQAAVAVVAALTLAYLTRPSHVRLLGLAAATAVALVTKQNTGAGAALGAGLALIVFSTAPPVVTIRRAALYAVASVVGVLTLLVGMAPWIDLGGFVQDVLLTGAEPKGGARVLLVNLGGFVKALVAMTLTAGIALPALGATVVALRRTSDDEDGGSALVRAAILTGTVATAGTVILLLVRATLPFRPFVFPIGCGPFTDCAPQQVLSIGLVVAMGLALVTGSRYGHDPSARALGVLTLVTLPAALFHNLSVETLRWTYDNNPVIQIAFAALFLAVIRASALVRRHAPALGVATLIAVATALQFIAWTLIADPLTSTRMCNQTWDDIPHLKGARMTSGATGLHTLVLRVRQLASAPTDTVLLLPSDPGVEAWFERPRAHLAAAIVFPDQYWPRMVEDDLARLAQDPPRVIVIGPVGKWSLLMGGWASGARELIDRVQSEILPRLYRDAGSQRVVQLGALDKMRIYVRRTPSSGDSAGRNVPGS